MAIGITNSGLCPLRRTAMSRIYVYNDRRENSPIGPNNPPSNQTGLISFIRCAKCKRETLEFTNVNSLKRYAASHGWRKIGKDYLCSFCVADNILYNE